MGGNQHISTATRVVVEVLTQDLAFLEKQNSRIFQAIRDYPKVKNSPKVLATLYSYRSPIVSNINKNLSLLGLTKATAHKDTGRDPDEDENSEQEGR